MNKLVGELGEELVDRWLQVQGYQTLHQRWHCRWGEIDLIAKQKSSRILAFVEIKTRNSRNWDAGGLLAVDRIKQAKLIKTANLFLAKNPDLESFPCRFDVAIVACNPTTKQGYSTISETMIRLGESITISGFELTLLEYLEGAFEVN
jgi:putative endonuclease